MKVFTLILLSLAWSLMGYAQSASENYKAKLQAEVNEETVTVYSIIFDTSGSMSGTKIQQAKEAFATWLQAVQPSNVWNLYKFADNGSQKVLDFKKNGQTEAAQLIAGFKADSNTPIVATLERAFADIQKRRQVKPYETHVLLLFTDGSENGHPRGNRAVVETINQIRKTNVEVVAIGYAGEGDYIRGSASRYYQANDGKALAAGLAQVESEIDPLAPVIITDQELEILKNPKSVNNAIMDQEQAIAASVAENNGVSTMIKIVLGLFIAFIAIIILAAAFQ